MPSICLYFRVHQSYRLKKYQLRDIDVFHCYADPVADKEAIDRMADECYLPANRIVNKLIDECRGQFKVSYSLSGTLIGLLQKYRPDVIDSFQKLVATGCVEILAETYYHSLSSLHSPKEFQRQINKHSQTIKELFSVDTAIFRNTELIHCNQLAEQLAGMGFKGILCEGVERILQGRTPNQVYTNPGNNNIGLLLRNARLSDDIAFRFDDVNWTEHPLTAHKFANWIHTHPAGTEVINLFMDYETFGIHKKENTGIFDFLKSLPAAVLKKDGFIFSTPSAVLENSYPKDIYNVSSTISWEDRAEDSCVWTENVMQHNTLKKIYSLEKMVMSSGCDKAVSKWGRLQSADHFYYMSDENEKYRNPFATAQEAFQNYINIIADFEISLIRKNLAQVKKHSVLRSVMNFF